MATCSSLRLLCAIAALPLFILLSAIGAAEAVRSAEAHAEKFLTKHSSNHTNNWAVLVDTSRFWFNYRHIANTLSLYRTVKRLGIPDSNIILMLADDMACNPRNVFPGKIFNNANHELNLYGDNIEVDYRGYEVTPESLLRVLTNRHPTGTPRSKRLLTDSGSNILFFMTGHGGDEFLKFQDQFEIMSQDLADAFGQMWEKRRYNEILFMVDTCQAATMAKQFYSPGIISIGSSALKENSYSHHIDREVGLSVIDRFTYYTLEFLEGLDTHSRITVDKLFGTLTRDRLLSNAEPQTRLSRRPLDSVRITDFFGSVVTAVHTEVAYPRFTGDITSETSAREAAGAKTVPFKPYMDYKARRLRRIDEVGLGEIEDDNGSWAEGGWEQLVVGTLAAALLASVALASLVAY